MRSSVASYPCPCPCPYRYLLLLFVSAIIAQPSVSSFTVLSIQPSHRHVHFHVHVHLVGRRPPSSTKHISSRVRPLSMRSEWSAKSILPLNSTQQSTAPTPAAVVPRISTPSSSSSSSSSVEQVPAMEAISSMAALGVATTTTTTTTTMGGDDEDEDGTDGDDDTAEYKRGLLTIGFITLLFSSNSPVLHAAFSGSNAPPVLLLNAAVSVVALVGLVLGGESLESNTPLPSSLLQGQQEQQPGQEKGSQDAMALTLQGGCELGLWKFLGTTANLYGLALTTAGHGALLIQLTTLIVPVVQGLQGVPIPRRIQYSVALALAGVVCFTQDPTGTPSATGDALCVVAAVFYATYDLRLFAWGKKVAPRRLITTKIGTQAILSTLLLVAVGGSEGWDYVVQLVASSSSSSISTAAAAAAGEDLTSYSWLMILPVVLWSGVAVNAVAPFLQVGGQQAVGPTRCQTIYASQPLWAALLSFVFLDERIGAQGFVGGSAFLVALWFAATAEAPDADCGQTNCEV